MSETAIATLSVDALDEVRELRIALHRHHSAIDIPPGWVSRDEDDAWRAWRDRADAVLRSGAAQLFVHRSGAGAPPDGYALVALLSPETLLRPVLEPDGPHAELLTISVLPGTRGGGVGTALYRAAMQWSREHGASVMHVDTRADNDDGARFYLRQGARPAFTQFMQPL